jgi:hypothetical protein
MFRLILVTIVLFSCQKRQENKPSIVQPLIAQKAELYKSLHKGWAHDKCDSLGFTSLCKLAGGCSEADVMQAEGEPGRWYRSPEKDCYDLGQSASDISKDMLTMLFPLLYRTGDKQNLQEIYDYGKANGWVMGRGPYSRTLMTPSMVAFLQELLGQFGLEMMPTDNKVKQGYEKHLDAIHVLTASFKRGGIIPSDYETMRKYTDESPRNALFQAIYHRFKDGNQQPTIDILMDETLFPSDRLPTTADRCEEYLWQRDGGSDWLPCDKGKTHDGVDFLFAAWVAGQL